MKTLLLTTFLLLAGAMLLVGAEFTNVTKATTGNLPVTSANAYGLLQTNATAVVRASLEQMRNRMLSEPANGLNITNIQGTNVVGTVQTATSAINATNLWGVAAQATHATNADYATAAAFATNLVDSASVTNLLLSGIGVADTNWVLQQISSLGSVHYLTGVTNTGSFTNSGETLPRTNNYITWLTVPTTVTTQSFGGLAANAYIRHNVTTNTYAVISAGPASVSSYCYRTGAGTVSGHYEIYAYDTVSNVLYELSSSSPVTIATGATPTRYDWQMTVPTDFVATNATKMVIAFKLDQIGSGGPVLSFVNGGNYDAHFTFSRPLSSATISGSQISGAVANATAAVHSTNYWGTLTAAQVTNALPAILTNAINTSGTVAADTVTATTLNMTTLNAGTLVVTNAPEILNTSMTNAAGETIAWAQQRGTPALTNLAAGTGTGLTTLLTSAVTNALPAILTNNTSGNATTATTATYLSGTVTNWDSSTNGFNGTIALGMKQYTNCAGLWGGLTLAGPSSPPTSTDRPGVLFIYNSSGSNFVVTTPASWKATDFGTTRTLTNGNVLVVSLDVWAEDVMTNAAIAQFK